MRVTTFWGQGREEFDIPGPAPQQAHLGLAIGTNSSIRRWFQDRNNKYKYWEQHKIAISVPPFMEIEHDCIGWEENANKKREFPHQTAFVYPARGAYSYQTEEGTRYCLYLLQLLIPRTPNRDLWLYSSCHYHPEPITERFYPLICSANCFGAGHYMAGIYDQTKVEYIWQDTVSGQSINPGTIHMVRGCAGWIASLLVIHGLSSISGKLPHVFLNNLTASA